MAAEPALRAAHPRSLDQHKEQLAVTDKSNRSSLSLLFGGVPVQGCWLGRGSWLCMQQAGKGTQHHVAAAMSPGRWASPQTSYIQLAGLGKPCQAPWGRVI